MPLAGLGAGGRIAHPALLAYFDQGSLLAERKRWWRLQTTMIGHGNRWLPTCTVGHFPFSISGPELPPRPPMRRAGLPGHGHVPSWFICYKNLELPRLIAARFNFSITTR